MTNTLELPDDLAQRLVADAEARGQDLNTYTVTMLREAAEVAPQSTAEPLPTSPAEAVAYWQRNGILGSYGDPAIDSPELARQLRRQAETRQW